MITSKHVLTAAHCIMKNLYVYIYLRFYKIELFSFGLIWNWYRAFVRLGEYDVRTSDNEPHEDVDILQVEVHEDFDLESLENDIAILILERSVVFNGNDHRHLTHLDLILIWTCYYVSNLFTDRIRPICLPFTEELINRRFVGYNPFIGKSLVVLLCQKTIWKLFLSLSFFTQIRF